MGGAILLEKPVIFDGKPITEGQVLIPLVAGYTAHAPSKKKPNYRLDIETAWSAEGCPLPSDVSWFTGGPQSRLKRIIVLLEFEKGTISVAAKNGGA